MKNRYLTIAVMIFLALAGSAMIYFAFQEKQTEEGEPARTVSVVRLKGDFEKKWAVNASGNSLTSLSAEDGKVIFSANGITAVDAEAGTILWESGAIISQEPLDSTAGTIVGVDPDGRVTAVDTQTGQERWRTATGAPGASAAIAGKSVFYATQDDLAVALDLDTGFERWRSSITGASDPRIYNTAAAEGDTMYVLSSDAQAIKNTLTAMNALDGTLRWTHAADGSNASICTSPGMTFMLTSAASGVPGGADHSLDALDTATGKLIWQSRIASDMPPVLKVIDETLYYGTYGINGAALHGLDPASGAERWSARPEARGSVPVAFAAQDGLVYLNDLSEIYAADANTGKIWWNVKTGGPLRVPPVIAGSTICFAYGSAGTLYALPLPEHY
ncbi:MAG: PQQ-binding-like beta-propeller repeat protein [Actinobacteria bacterium]|nr:PQQ-binding-like beta-propeller repeat protein [Actinomycetota bacterium]